MNPADGCACATFPTLRATGRAGMRFVVGEHRGGAPATLLVIPHGMTHDIPRSIDLRTMPDAVEWEQSAVLERRWRTEIFASFCGEIAACSVPVRRVLELGSGPGFLAK